VTSAVGISFVIGTNSRGHGYRPCILKVEKVRFWAQEETSRIAEMTNHEVHGGRDWTRTNDLTNVNHVYRPAKCQTMPAVLKPAVKARRGGHNWRQRLGWASSLWEQDRGDDGIRTRDGGFADPCRRFPDPCPRFRGFRL